MSTTGAGAALRDSTSSSVAWLVPLDAFDGYAHGMTDEMDGAVEAGAYVRAALARNLREAREHAKLTQAELATALKVPPETVSASERGETSVSERYVLQVLKACGLPEDWPKAK